MTPKSLLRHPAAVSVLDDLVNLGFRPVLDDPGAADRKREITRLLLCTGKIYYELEGAERRAPATHVAIGRIEELYPFPAEELTAMFETYPSLEEVLWVQEEPKNMGAWLYVEQRLRNLLGTELPLRYIGRPERASPAEGYANVHERQQAELIEAALSTPARTPAARRARSR
jgi:2-oxoglutarate dehydrogenase E1 component